MSLIEEAARSPSPVDREEASLPVDEETAQRDTLVTELGVLRTLLRGEHPDEAIREATAVKERLGRPSTLDLLAADLLLSDFERAVLLLAAGPELVAAVAPELEDVTGSPVLTFGAAMHLLPGAHWSALTPGAPLRRWGLLTLDDPRSPAHSPLTVDERILHHLVGAGALDARLTHLVRWAPSPVHLPRTLQDAAHDLALRWQEGSVVVQGRQVDNGRAVAVAAAALSGSVLREVSGADLPTDPVELSRVVGLLERESRLEACAWLVLLDDVPAEGAARIARACAPVQAPLALLTDDANALLGSRRAGITVVPVPRLDLPGRAELLVHALEAVGAPTGDVPVVAGVFDLTVGQAMQVAQDVADGADLWQASRSRSQVETGGVARRVEPRATWADLVLPAAQIDQLRALVSAVRHRSLVLDEWGYSRSTARGLGTTSLFAGASGTGKTLAAEVVAHELDLDLLHVDLSQVVSKYIGETEKNLGAVFDAAERGSAVLLFDEADTLFGKRSEVKDSHDRYANLEVGYLLQRMEQFRGLAILTTNARGALDQAFLRRLHAVVAFPYPDVAARARMWRIAFPPQTPTEGVDVDALAQVDVPGGAIAAAALTAAYLAAGDGGLVTTAHVREALGWELAKSGRAVAGRADGLPRGERGR